MKTTKAVYLVVYNYVNSADFLKAVEKYQFPLDWLHLWEGAGIVSGEAAPNAFNLKSLSDHLHECLPNGHFIATQLAPHLLTLGYMNDAVWNFIR